MMKISLLSQALSTTRKNKKNNSDDIRQSSKSRVHFQFFNKIIQARIYIYTYEN